MELADRYLLQSRLCVQACHLVAIGWNAVWSEMEAVVTPTVSRRGTACAGDGRFSDDPVLARVVQRDGGRVVAHGLDRHPRAQAVACLERSRRIKLLDSAGDSAIRLCETARCKLPPHPRSFVQRMWPCAVQPPAMPHSIFHKENHRAP
jgi:hypothetical protein